MSSVDSPSSSESSFEPSITEKLGKKHVWFRITNPILDDDYNPLIPERGGGETAEHCGVKDAYMGITCYPKRTNIVRIKIFRKRDFAGIF